MDPKTDIVIVSAFGRGHWISQELLRQGYKVGLVDVSGRLGRWAPEDWEGPFPFFETSQLYPSQLARLVEDEETISLDRGFCLWLNEGPLELKSPLTTFLLRQRQVPSDVEDYLLKVPSESTEQIEGRKNKLRSLGFNKNWLAHFAHQWSSTVYQPNHLGLEQGNALALFTPASIRRPSRFSFEKSLQELKRRGGDLILGSELKDISVSGRQITAVEVGSDLTGGVISGHMYLWMLTSQETEYVSKSMSQLLFPKGAVDPMWVWLRFRLEFKSGNEKHAIPDHFVIVEHLDLPWTRDNVLTCVKAPNPSQLDVWIRVPRKQRFQRQDMEEMSAEIIRKLRTRMPASDPQLLEMPQEYHYNYDELGPSRHVVFDRVLHNSEDTHKLSNLMINSPETWDRLDWNSQLESQKKVYEEVCKQIRQREGATNDSEIHP